MSANLPYLSAPTNIPKALEKIRTAPTPPRVTQDFVKTKLQIPGGSGNQMTAYLKRIGFVRSDGVPTDLYVMYRNRDTAGVALSKSIRIGYAPLYEHNEYVHDLPDAKLRGLIVQVTGWADDARGVDLALKCFSSLKAHAKFDEQGEEPEHVEPPRDTPTQDTSVALPSIAPPAAQNPHGRDRGLGMNLSYTINLNLPASTDIAVFNAIFKSLKENLLRDIDEHTS